MHGNQVITPVQRASTSTTLTGAANASEVQRKKALVGKTFDEQEAMLAPDQAPKPEVEGDKGAVGDVLEPPTEAPEAAPSEGALEEAAAITTERSTSLSSAPKHNTSTKKKRSYTTYTPKDKKRLKRDVKEALSDGSLASKVTRVITRDGDSKTFEELKGLDGLTFGITDFATTGGVHTFFTRFGAAFPKDFRRLFPTLHTKLVDEKWLEQHNAGEGKGAEADDAGLITLPEVRIGLSKLLADPRFRKFQVGEFARGKIAGPQRLLDQKVKPSKKHKARENGADEAYGKVLRQFTVAALASVANSAGPGVAVPWFRDGLAGAGGLTGIPRENAACIHMLRRYLETAHPDRELKKYPDGVAFLNAAIADPAGALAKEWKLGHRGKRIEKLFEVFDFTASDPVPKDILQPQAASSSLAVKGDEPQPAPDAKVAEPGKIDKPTAPAKTDKKEEAKGPLTASQIKDALRYNRGRALAKNSDRLMLVQKALGVAASGIFDEATVLAVATFQTKAGTKGDGKIGPTTEELLAPLVDALVPAAKKPTPTPEVGSKSAALPKVAETAPVKPPAGEVLADAKATTHAVEAVSHEVSKKDVKGGAPGKGAALTPESWATVPPEAKAKADGPLSDKDIGRAVAALSKMDKRLDPEWIIGVQAALGVPTTGGFTRAFLQAIAKFQVERMGQKKPDGGLEQKAVREAIKAAFPALAKLPEFFGMGSLKGAAEELGKGYPLHDRILKEAGVAKSWSEYATTIKSTQLVGHTVTGNPAFLERVQVAQKYLEVKFGMTGKDLGKAVGVSTVTDMRPPDGSRKNKAGYHTFGFALDLDPANNPWIMREKGNDTKAASKHLREVMERAGQLMGYGKPISNSAVAKLGDTMTSDEIYEFLQTSNVALRNYRMLAGNDKAIASQLEKAGPTARAQGDAKWWAGQIQKDDAKLDDKKFSAWCNSHSNKGFMTMREEMVVALRDIAGLAWGGCDLGNDTGDMMHFDARNFGYARKLDKTSDKVKADMGLK